MRCMLCNAEMTLIAAVKDESLMASGFERHVYMCSECGDTERRFVFNRSETPEIHVRVHSPGEEHIDSTLVPEPTDVVPPSNPTESAVPTVFFKRVLSKLRMR